MWCTNYISLAGIASGLTALSNLTFTMSLLHSLVPSIFLRVLTTFLNRSMLTLSLWISWKMVDTNCSFAKKLFLEYTHQCFATDRLSVQTSGGTWALPWRTRLTNSSTEATDSFSHLFMSAYWRVLNILVSNITHMFLRMFNATKHCCGPWVVPKDIKSLTEVYQHVLVVCSAK